MVINLVTKWRQAKRVSKAHMARYVGVNRSYLTKLEQGKMQPSGEMMFRIANYLGQPLEAVFQHVQVSEPNAIFCARVMPESQTRRISHLCPAAEGNHK